MDRYGGSRSLHEVFRVTRGGYGLGFDRYSDRYVSVIDMKIENDISVIVLYL